MKTDLQPNESSSHPTSHRENMQQRLTELIEHARKDIHQVDEPRFQALLETTAEVLSGLKTAFEHYGQGKEEAWPGGTAKKMKFAPPNL